MRRVVGAVCIENKSGSTNFLLQATANKVSRRALLNHHFVVPLLRWRMLLRILCVRKIYLKPPLSGEVAKPLGFDGEVFTTQTNHSLPQRGMLLKVLCIHHGSFVNDPYEVLLRVIKISLFLVCRGRQPYLLCKLTTRLR